MPDKYVLKDRWGRKIGTIQRSLGVGPYVLMVVAILGLMIVSAPIFMVVGAINKVVTSIRPTMPITYFPSVRGAQTNGDAEVHDEFILLHPGASINFVIDNSYADS